MTAADLRAQELPIRLAGNRLPVENPWSSEEVRQPPEGFRLQAISLMVKEEYELAARAAALSQDRGPAVLSLVEEVRPGAGRRSSLDSGAAQARPALSKPPEG